MDPNFRAGLANFYEEQLFGNILPFWLNHGIDLQYGGYYTCFNNSGTKLLSTDKYVWSQGRMVWLLAKLAQITGNSEYLDLSRLGANFLAAHSILPDGSCAFLLSRDGTPREPEPGKGYSYSIYADCFACLGFAKYAAVSGDPSPLGLALNIFDSILGRLERNEFQTNPEPTPAGLKCHGIPMILLNVGRELADALDLLDHPRTAEVNRRCVGFLQEIFAEFLEGDIIQEMIRPGDRSRETFLTRYINPGHSIEDMWFVIHQALKMGDKSYITRAAAVIAKMFELGWDEEFGGLFHYLDRDGGPPRGPLGDPGESYLATKIGNDWDSKLWWVHVEALYGTLLAYSLTGSQTMFEHYRKVHDYAFATFPNPDREIGEWIQIRDRNGRPLEKVVALPVKDPFHIARSFALIIELLRGDVKKSPELKGMKEERA